MPPHGRHDMDNLLTMKNADNFDITISAYCNETLIEKSCATLQRRTVLIPSLNIGNLGHNKQQ